MGRMWVCKGGLIEARGVTMWAGLCVKGGGEGSSEMGRVDKVQRMVCWGWALPNWWGGDHRQVQYGNGSDKWKMRIPKKKEAQGRGAMSFPEGLYLKVKETVWKRNL